MPKSDHRSQMARAWLHFHAARKGRGSGSAAPRVDWPVYPRRAEHTTVAERGIEDGSRLRADPFGLSNWQMQLHRGILARFRRARPSGFIACAFSSGLPFEVDDLPVGRASGHGLTYCPTGICGCCPRAASGNDPATPPISVMNARRFTAKPSGHPLGHASLRFTVPPLQDFRPSNVGSWPEADIASAIADVRSWG
jgi:hypothetical protein